MDPRVADWLARDPDPETRAELMELVAAGDDREVERRFRQRLAFGTAGLRGLLGTGTNRMNRLVVRETTAGLGAYLCAQIPDAPIRGVVIGFDGRHKSRAFAQDAACVLAGLGIKVYLFAEEVPTPACAFAVRHLGTAASIVITASHNPPAYNGYKVYWDNGAQIIGPHDTGIAAAIEDATRQPLPWRGLDEARTAGAIETLGEPLLADYLDAVAALSLHPASPSRDRLRIVYTPMHGVGWPLAERALARAGFGAVHVVTSQRDPDPDFSTVAFPNPEEPGAMDEALALARQAGADLIVANDPDADRFAAAVRDGAGGYRMLTGDQVGVLLGADFVAQAPPDSVVATTIVSSRMLGVIARAAGVGYFCTLTGFKWIAAGGFAHEARGERFLFGYEEALGYTIGGSVRDKDGISAMVAFAELAAACAAQGRTILEQLESLYRDFGLYLTRQQSIRLDPDREGPTVGELLRRDPPNTVGGLSVVSTVDVQTRVRRLADGRCERIDLPPSDVLVFELDRDARVVVRPSGTEPKLKCYYEVCEHVGEGELFFAAEQRAQTALDELVGAHQTEIAALSTTGIAS